MELIISSATERRRETISWISCQTTEGHITILEGHAPFIALIQPMSELIIGHSAERTETILLTDGYLTVNPTQILIIMASP
jgi:F0F1-type ATP synthase epsilon subunit